MLYSGAHRTRQTAAVMGAALGLWIDPVVEGRFHFQPVIDELYPDDPGAVLRELKDVRKAGGNVAVAATMSEYARRSGERLLAGILGVADQHPAGADILVISHSPYAECATMLIAEAAKNCPYGLGESDAVVYAVEGGVVLNAQYIPAPLEGATN